jgi:hypothetical protein
MRRISSKSTWWHKKAFPTIWFGLFGLFTLVGLFSVINGRAPAPALLIPLFGMAAGYSFMRWLVFSLLDEVWIDGDQIVVRNGGREDRFPLSNILNVDASLFTNPERIVLTLRQPCAFGDEVAFLPTPRFWPFGRHPLAKELIRRIHHLDEARPTS